MNYQNIKIHDTPDCTNNNYNGVVYIYPIPADESKGYSGKYFLLYGVFNLYDNLFFDDRIV